MRGRGAVPGRLRRSPPPGSALGLGDPLRLGAGYGYYVGAGLRARTARARVCVRSASLLGGCVCVSRLYTLRFTLSVTVWQGSHPAPIVCRGVYGWGRWARAWPLRRGRVGGRLLAADQPDPERTGCQRRLALRARRRWRLAWARCAPGCLRQPGHCLALRARRRRRGRYAPERPHVCSPPVAHVVFWGWCCGMSMTSCAARCLRGSVQGVLRAPAEGEGGVAHREAPK